MSTEDIETVRGFITSARRALPGLFEHSNHAFAALRRIEEAAPVTEPRDLLALLRDVLPLVVQHGSDELLNRMQDALEGTTFTARLESPQPAFSGRMTGVAPPREGA